MIVGLTGTKAAGKSIIAQLLIEQGFRNISLSDMVRAEAERKKVTNCDVFKLQEVGRRLREEKTRGVLATQAIEVMINSPGDYVVDSIRNVEEIREFRRHDPGFILIALDAPQAERYERLIKRSRPSDPKNWEDFQRMEKIDLGEGKLDSGQQVYACMAEADIKIYNSSMSGIREKVRPIVEKILLKRGLTK